MRWCALPPSVRKELVQTLILGEEAGDEVEKGIDSNSEHRFGSEVAWLRGSFQLYVIEVWTCDKLKYCIEMMSPAESTLASSVLRTVDISRVRVLLSVNAHDLL
jgi:hypothetical protein